MKSPSANVEEKIRNMPADSNATHASHPVSGSRVTKRAIMNRTAAELTTLADQKTDSPVTLAAAAIAVGYPSGRLYETARANCPPS